jgi:hypothetical protein
MPEIEHPEPAPARHPLVVWVNAVNGDTLPRCFPDVEAAYDAAATEYPYDNTRVTLGWCTQTHGAAAAGEDGS